MATRKTTKRKPVRRKSRKPVQHSAWKPGWYRRMELRKRHAEQVVSFWCRFAVRAIGYGLAMITVFYVLTTAYFGG
jgi:hypothetical protein